MLARPFQPREQGPGREKQNIKEADKSALRQRRKAETPAWEMTSERTPGYKPMQQDIDDNQSGRLYRIDAALVRDSLRPPRVRVL